MAQRTHEAFGRGKWFPVFVVIFWMVGCQMPIVNPFLRGLDLKRFEQVGPLVVYNRVNIFDYIDGEAEAYLPHGFQLLYQQSYQTTQSAARIVVDAYDMATSAGAKAVFQKYTEEGGSNLKGPGQSAWTDNHIVLFCRGKYFFRVFPDPSPESEPEPSLSEILELSHAVDHVISKPI